jgi:hypothetical protein
MLDTGKELDLIAFTRQILSEEKQPKIQPTKEITRDWRLLLLAKTIVKDISLGKCSTSRGAPLGRGSLAWGDTP